MDHACVGRPRGAALLSLGAAVASGLRPHHLGALLMVRPPTGDCCEWCPPDCGPEARLCSACGWTVQQCRLCRMRHLSDHEHRIVRPPPESATNATHRCNDCGRQGMHLLACGKCQCTRYCDHTCQKRDWKLHKCVCAYLATLVTPTLEQLHFVYPWHMHLVPAAIGRVPHGVCTSALDAYNAACFRAERSNAQPSSMEAAPLEHLSDLSRRQRRQAGRRLMRRAHVRVVDGVVHLGVSLTDGVGCIDPELLENLVDV